MDYLATMDILRDVGNVDVRDLRDGDPWGSPYLIDENEGEPRNGFCERKDAVISAGRNGVYEGGANDDLFVILPRRKRLPDC